MIDYEPSAVAVAVAAPLTNLRLLHFLTHSVLLLDANVPLEPFPDHPCYESVHLRFSASNATFLHAWGYQQPCSSRILLVLFPSFPYGPQQCRVYAVVVNFSHFLPTPQGSYWYVPE